MEYPTKLFSLDTGYFLGNGANIQVGLGETGFGLRDRVQLTTNTLLDAATMPIISVISSRSVSAILSARCI